MNDVLQPRIRSMRAVLYWSPGLGCYVLVCDLGVLTMSHRWVHARGVSVQVAAPSVLELGEHVGWVSPGTPPADWLTKVPYRACRMQGTLWRFEREV